MTEEVDTGRRHFLTVATVATGAVGAAFVAVPFLASWKPSARAKAMGAPVEVDISKLEPGAMLKVEWRGKAIYVVQSHAADARRSSRAVDARLRDPDSAESEQPAYAKNAARALEARVPGAGRRLHAPRLRAARQVRAGRRDGFAPTGRAASSARATARSSTSSGRVFKDVPAPTNLPVPPYRFVSDTRILIGADTGNA